MGLLPTARNTTYSPGATAVRAADLNDLQDCFVGAKVPSLPLFVPACAFVVDQGAPTRSQNIWTCQTNADNILVAPLKLPIGTRITDLVWNFNRNSANNNGLVELDLNRFPINGGSASAEVLSLLATGTGWTMYSQIIDFGLPHVILNNNFYHLQFKTRVTNGGNNFTGAPTFGGVKVVIDRL